MKNSCIRKAVALYVNLRQFRRPVLINPLLKSSSTSKITKTNHTPFIIQIIKRSMNTIATRVDRINSVDRMVSDHLCVQTNWNLKTFRSPSLLLGMIPDFAYFSPQWGRHDSS